MGFRRLILVLVALLVVPICLARERVEERTFPATGISTLKIATYRGTITVESSDENVIRVKVTATTAFEREDAAVRALAQLQLNWQQAQNTVTLTTGNPQGHVRFFWQDDEQLGVDIAVTVPRACALDLVSGNGGIKVGDIAGHVSVKTGAGSIFCRHIDGDLVARNAQGDIIVSRCTGNADLNTQRGIVRTGLIVGKATVTAVNGDIEIMAVSGGIVARTSAGDITAGITRQFSGEASVRADGGNVTLKIDPAANIEITASSVWGQVRTVRGQLDLPLVTESGGLGRRSFVARLNGGASAIEARASGGHVNLESEVPPFG